jgi:hypothetical protein
MSYGKAQVRQGSSEDSQNIIMSAQHVFLEHRSLNYKSARKSSLISILAYFGIFSRAVLH